MNMESLSTVVDKKAQKSPIGEFWRRALLLLFVRGFQDARGGGCRLDLTQ
jgi:hypothetical protein